MKTSTQIGIISSVAVVAFSSHLYAENSNKILQEQIQQEQIAADIQVILEAEKQLNCLAKNIYFEAKSEGLTGQRAVAWATLNRVESPKYPDTICEVVHQAKTDENGIPIRDQCQFSFYCDGKSDKIKEQDAWELAQDIAFEVYSAYGNETDPTNGAIMYHARYVEPYWVTSYEKTVRIDSHIFYK